MPERRWTILLAFAAIYVIWGSTYLAIRFAIETLPPFLMAGTRFVLAGTPLYLWARLRGEERPTAANWRATAILGGLLLVGGNGLVSWAELRVASGLAALLVSTVPLFVVLLEWLGPRAVRVGPPRRLVSFGVFAGLAGIVLLIGPGDLLGARVDLLGAATLVIASLSWAFGSTLSKRLALPSSPILGTAMQMLAGGVLLLIVSGATGELGRFDPGAVSLKSLLALGYLVVFGAIVAFTAYVYLLQNVAVAKVATYAYVNPIVALALGWAMANESLSARTLVAATVILGAVVLITTQRRSPKPPALDSKTARVDGPTPARYVQPLSATGDCSSLARTRRASQSIQSASSTIGGPSVHDQLGGIPAQKSSTIRKTPPTK